MSAAASIGIHQVGIWIGRLAVFVEVFHVGVARGIVEIKAKFLTLLATSMHHIIGTTGGHGIVARILIRNLDGTTIERLKFRAAQNGRSLQAEVEDLPQIGGGTYMPKDFDYWPLA